MLTRNSSHKLHLPRREPKSGQRWCSGALWCFQMSTVVSLVSPVLLIIPLSVWNVWFGNFSHCLSRSLVHNCFLFPTCITLTPHVFAKSHLTPGRHNISVAASNSENQFRSGCYLALWWTSTDRAADLAVNASECACSGETLLMWLIVGHDINICCVWHLRLKENRVTAEPLDFLQILPPSFFGATLPMFTSVNLGSIELQVWSMWSWFDRFFVFF